MKITLINSEEMRGIILEWEFMQKERNIRYFKNSCRSLHTYRRFEK
jgi:hypothetical protein